MSQRVVTSWLNTNIPGAYPNTTVISTPVGLGSSGIVVIMGEADGGNSYQNVPLAHNVFTPDQLSKVISQYTSGQIVDAFSALTSPSNDANITGTANQIYIVKTNSGTKASATVDTNYGTLFDINWGIQGNSDKYQITTLQAEVTPSVTSGTITVFTGLSGDSFTVRLNGGAATLVTLSGVITDIPSLVTSLNNAFTSASITTLTAAPNSLSPTNSFVISMNVDAGAYRNGWGKSFELIDSTPGDLAALSLTAGLHVSSAEPEDEVMVSNATTGLNETLEVIPDVSLLIGYQGTTATLTINQAAGTLTTTVTGGSGANLSVMLNQYKTIADLAAFINAQTGYTAIVNSTAQQQAPSTLDTVSAQGIASTGTGLTPGRIKDGAATFQQIIGTSTGVTFTPTATAGIPNPMASAAFLTGGSRGGTLAVDIINALEQIGGIQCNIIVPLFSQDSSADIAAGYTASSSTYTIAGINTAVKNHCIQFSTPKLKRNRIAICSYNGTYANIVQTAQTLANYRISLAFQQATQDNSKGVITKFLPWYTACVAAGMQAGGFYKSITNKLANVNSFTDPSGFDSGSPGDVEDALSAGLLFLTSTSAGSLWVSDQTTYGYDTNFVYNSIQAVYDSDILALDLASSFQTAFVGQSLADVDAATALSYLAQKMEGYKKLKLIAASNDAPLGYKNASVSIRGPEMDIAVEIKLATAIYFIPISISISQVQQQA